MLAKRFEHILHDLGMAGLEHPLFYHAPVGIRFKIGGEEPIYLDRRAAKLKTNPAYVQGALDRAAAIYRALPAVPDLLRIDGYPDEEPAESLLTVIRQRVGLPVPDEQLSATEQDEDGDTHAQVQFYWDLSKISFQPELLLREIILGDIGGTALCPASIWLGRGRSSTICTMTVGWMCWAAHRSCYCLSIINFMTGFWNTIWRRLTRCSLQQKNDCITEKETLLWDLIFTPGR
jgi:hypothetical protein